MVDDDVVLYRSAIADLPLVDHRGETGPVRQRMALDLLFQLRDGGRRVVGGIQDARQGGARLARQDAAHARHQAEDLLPRRGIALHARRPAALLVAEGTFAHELLAHLRARHRGERKREPAVGGERGKPVVFVRFGLHPELQFPASELVPHHVGVAEAEVTGAQVVGAGGEVGKGEAALGIGIDRGGARE